MMESSLIKPGQAVEITCQALFLCGYITMDALQVHITTDGIFVSAGTMIKTADKPKASNGRNGATPGASGENGAEGAAAEYIALYPTERHRHNAICLLDEVEELLSLVLISEHWTMTVLVHFWSPMSYS